MVESNVIKENPGFIPECMGTKSIVYEYLGESTGYLPSGCDESVTHLIIPSEHEGRKVLEIDDWGFRGYENLESVIIPEGIRVINHEAFAGCTNLREVTIPSSVRFIVQDAFEDCEKLEKVYICDLEAWLKIDFDGYEANPLYYAHNLYLNGKQLTDIEIPKLATKIDMYAFCGMSSLKSVTIPFGVTSIDNHAFSGASSLESLIIPCSVTEIGAGAFSGCDKLTIYAEAASEPTSWKRDEYYPDWDNGVHKVVWGYNNITTDRDYDYVVHNQRAHLTEYKGQGGEVVVPNSIDGIPVADIGLTFQNNTDITKVSIPSTTRIIRDYAFYHCINLQSIDMLNVTGIGVSAFCGCVNLTDVDITYSMKCIGRSAFQSCIRLSKIFLPMSVKGIDTFAFAKCRSLSIYAETNYLPDGWSSDWCSGVKQVVWDCKAVYRHLSRYREMWTKENAAIHKYLFEH